MKNNTLFMAGLALLALGIAETASAQVYRCGNKYQSHPCEAGTQTKVINSSSAPQPTAKQPQDAVCTPRGASVMKIMWAREAGATAERQLSDTNNPEERKLILDVYQKHGTAREVRAAIEADCMAEKERLALASELAAAAARLSNQSQSPQAMPRGSSDAEIKAAESRSKEEEATRKANMKKTQCDNYEARIENIRKYQRVGSSAQGMESLNQQRRDIEKEKHDSGC
jgi:hypothetical protein